LRIAGKLLREVGIDIYRQFVAWSAVMRIAGLLELGMIVPVWIILKTRLKEIEGGEEDAAQY